jgi:DNA-binding beta-propeller fold protein YncE
MNWQIKHIFNYPKDKHWEKGYAHFGFHGKKGDQYLLQWDEHWLGRLTPDDHFLWTAGAVNKGLSQVHIKMDVSHPHYISESPDGSLTLTSNGNNKIFKIFPERRTAEVFIDTGRLGFVDAGNCVYDTDDNLWIHEIRGCKVWQFDVRGKPLRILGSGQAGFQKETVPFEEAGFNWIYDMRLGPDGNMYVLDSKNFAVRMIDIARQEVSMLVGTGEPGDSGDGGDASRATLGSKPGEYFDGPLSMALDEEGNIYIGDTQNHVLRVVDRQTNIISTIAGKRDAQPHRRNDSGKTNPLELNLPKICSLDYYRNCIFLPEVDDDLIILEKMR